MSDERLIRIEDKIDRLAEHITSIDKTLIRQEDQLAYHIKRTDLLESQIKPLENAKLKLDGAMKFVASIVGVISVIAAIAEILSYLSGK